MHNEHGSVEIRITYTHIHMITHSDEHARRTYVGKPKDIYQMFGQTYDAFFRPGYPLANVRIRKFVPTFIPIWRSSLGLSSSAFIIFFIRRGPLLVKCGSAVNTLDIEASAHRTRTAGHNARTIPPSPATTIAQFFCHHNRIINVHL